MGSNRTNTSTVSTILNFTIEICDRSAHRRRLCRPVGFDHVEQLGLGTKLLVLPGARDGRGAGPDGV